MMGDGGWGYGIGIMMHGGWGWATQGQTCLRLGRDKHAALRARGHLPSKRWQQAFAESSNEAIDAFLTWQFCTFGV